MQEAAAGSSTSGVGLAGGAVTVCAFFSSRLVRCSSRRISSSSVLFSSFEAFLNSAMLLRGVQERNGERVLVGTAGSPGRARGRARLIAGPQDFHRLQPGDVLVTHTTTPIWTPLFSIASAAVTEVGGPMSHAAIVAREFGIPLVNGALDATQVIMDGMSVVVDGSAGIVEL